MFKTAVWDATKSQWNVANAVTLSRALIVSLIPVGILLGDHWLGFLVWYAAASDGLDGWLARKRGEETPIGVIGDPLADKIFTDMFLVYATVTTGSWEVATLAGVTLLYDFDNTYQRRIDIANAFKGIKVSQTMPATWLSKTKTFFLFGFMMAVIYPQFLPFLTVNQFAVFCLFLILCSWVQNRRLLIREFIGR